MRPHRDPEATFASFVELWQRLLADAAAPGSVALVEGERDRRSLERLGWPGPIAVVHRGRSLSATAQALVESSRRVIVLTDWDAEGGTLARRLRGFLLAERTELDLDARRRLARLLRGELAHVEGLYGWVRRNAERYGVALEAIVGGVDADGPRRATG